MTRHVEQMKWWGWGAEGSGLDVSDKPDLWPFIEQTLGLPQEPETVRPVGVEGIELPDRRVNERFLGAVRRHLRDHQLRDDRLERLVHAYGKSFRDLWRVRRGIVEAAPDVVLYPESEADVVSIVRAAAEHDAVLIPFGGGSNIAGCLEAIDARGRMIVSLDMKRMDRVLEVDESSHTARIEAGVLGPELEDQLRPRGVTLGHFPDSFVHSTLGGWIATRSAGMQSDKYGKIEDMVLALRMVTPSGTIATRTVPKASNGIDVNHLGIGSEGTLGVITEATMQVHPLPERREAYGYLFPDWESGVAAVRACVEQDCVPVVTRLNDPMKTALSFAYKTKSPPVQAIVGKVFKGYLRRVKRFDLGATCLMLTAYEGLRGPFRTQRRRVEAIYSKHGAVALGTGPGRSFEAGKYDFPHIRDLVMGRNVFADVSETCTVWSNLLPLYHATRTAIETAIRDTGSQPFVGCHLSHTYRSGASLYFTFGARQRPGYELEQYLYAKKAAEDAFLAGGATLSHHHAVGIEHLPWVEADVSRTGLLAVRALKSGLDPTAIMNPGKVIPAGDPLEGWGLGAEAVRVFQGRD